MATSTLPSIVESVPLIILSIFLAVFSSKCTGRTTMRPFLFTSRPTNQFRNHCEVKEKATCRPWTPIGGQAPKNLLKINWLYVWWPNVSVHAWPLLRRDAASSFAATRAAQNGRIRRVQKSTGLCRGCTRPAAVETAISAEKSRLSSESPVYVKIPPPAGRPRKVARFLFRLSLG